MRNAQQATSQVLQMCYPYASRALGDDALFVRNEQKQYMEPALLYTPDVMDFCAKHAILSECYKYHELFVETFSNIRGITVSISGDYEITGYHTLSFVLNLSDEIENVLKLEETFQKKLRQEIEIEKRHYFTYNFNLI